jgi:Family of unknown function (DUF6682)
MPVTLGDYIRRARSILDEPETRFWTDTEITDWINDGARDLARKAEDLLVYDTSLAIAANVGSYPLPADCIRVHRAEFVPTNSTQQYPIRASSQDEMDNIWGVYQQNSSSYPSWFVTRGYPGGSGASAFTIQFFPVPAQTGHVNLFYYKMPRRLTDPVADPLQLAITIDMPEGWDDLILMYVEWRALRKTRDPRWTEAYGLYKDQLDYLLNVTRYYHDQQQMMTSFARTSQPSWLTDWPD